MVGNVWCLVICNRNCNTPLFVEVAFGQSGMLGSLFIFADVYKSVSFEGSEQEIYTYGAWGGGEVKDRFYGR